MELNQTLAVATKVARYVGSRIRDSIGTDNFSSSLKSRDDLVTQIDVWSESEIRKSILDSFPDHLVIGEESSSELQSQTGKTLQQLSSSGWSWIVDPLDGTANFVSGIPYSAVSIALLFDGEVVMGVVYDPFRDEMFTAVKGQGAQLNDNKIFTRNTGKLSDAVITTGFPSTRYQFWPLFREAHLALIENCRRVRMLGASALELCWVAGGRTDGFFEYHLKCWDVAAGSLIVQEAGGDVGCIVKPGGYNIFSETCLASGREIFQPLTEICMRADMIGRRNQEAKS